MSGSTVRRRPIFTVLSVILPVAGIVGMYAYDHKPKPVISSGGWGLGEIFIFVMIGVLGLVFGLVAVVIAVVRRERWVPVQWAMGLLNLVASLLVLALLTGQFRR